MAGDNIRFRQPDSVRGIKNGYIGKANTSFFQRNYYRTPYSAPKGWGADSTGKIRAKRSLEYGFLRLGGGPAWMLSPVRSGVSEIGQEHYRKLRSGTTFEFELGRYLTRHFGIAIHGSYFKSEHDQNWEFNHYYNSTTIGVKACFRFPIIPKKGHYFFANPGIGFGFGEGGYKKPHPYSAAGTGLVLIGSAGFVWAPLPHIGLYVAATGSTTVSKYHAFDTKIDGSTALSRAGAVAGINLSF